jgi:hypothetical protein
LIHFNVAVTDEKRLLAELQGQWDQLLAAHKGVDVTAVPVERREPARASLLRVGVRGFLGHAVVDSVWFAAGFLGETLGLPLAGLGPLHILTDIAVWAIALASGNVWCRRIAEQDDRQSQRRSSAGGQCCVAQASKWPSWSCKEVFAR